MSYFSANSEEPIFTVRAFKVYSWPIGNEAIMVFVRVLVKICWTSQTLVVRHILGNQAATNCKLLRIRVFTRHPIEVQPNAVCGFTNRTILHETKLTRTTDIGSGDLDNYFGLLSRMQKLHLSLRPDVGLIATCLNPGGVFFLLFSHLFSLTSPVWSGIQKPHPPKPLQIVSKNQAKLVTWMAEKGKVS